MSDKPFYISSDNLSQLPQYSSALDSLRNSINGLGKSVNELNKEIDTYNKKSQESTNWGAKIKNTVKDLVDTFKSFKDILSLGKESVGNWVNALAVGFTLITTYGPQILEYLNNIFQSDKVREAARELKAYKEVMEDYAQNISKELAVTQTLINLAKDKSASRGLQIEAIRTLNNLSPEHLNNLTLENLKTKEGKELLDEYIKSLNRKAMMEAVQAKKAEYIKQRLDLKPEYDEAKSLRDDYYSGKKRGEKRGGHEVNGIYTAPRDDKAASQERFAKAAEEDRTILRLIAKLDADLFADLKANAPKTPTNTIHDKQYWEVQLMSKQEQLNKLDASAKDFTEKAKAIKTNILVINKILANYNVDNNSKKSNKPKPFDEEAFKAHLAASAEFHEQRIRQITDKFEKEVLQRQRNYDIEKKELDNELQQKLISQEEYFESWEKLQEKYHADIGESLKLFNERDLARTQKHQRDLVEAEQLKADKKGIEDAVWPAQKLAAEKKLIEDKYWFEIQKAAEAGKDTAEIRERYQVEMTDTTKKHEQERKDFQMQTAQQVSDAAFSILRNNSKAQTDAKLKQLDTQKQAELANTSLTGSQKKAIEDKYKKKEAEEKTKAFKAEQKMSILQAVINGALAITKVTAQTGVISPFIIPGIIASTAIQVATIAAQKTPQYAKGGLHYQSDGKGALLSGYSRTDDTNAYLRSGEAVVVSEAMRNPWARNLVSAINVAHGGRDFSIANPSRGYAIGGIFTDGGNSNRYYNQPMNDQKDLANTIAYQMINNFPPLYVDVKDINSQQGILAQTVNRVNL